MPAEFWQMLVPSHREQLAADPHALACLEVWRNIIHTVWLSDTPPPADWLQGKLVQLYKGKKDIVSLKNWRVIMLLDAASKILAAIIASRLEAHFRQHGAREQYGFTRKPCTTDAIFALKMALSHRHAAGLPTFALFVDLEKAFDSVEHAALWSVLRKFGMLDDLIRIIVNLHNHFSFTVNTGGSTAELPYTCGVCQGDNLAAVLFLFFLQASLERIEQQWEGQAPIFATNLDGRLTADAWNRAPDPRPHASRVSDTLC
jgi:hypothetical protein